MKILRNRKKSSFKRIGKLYYQDTFEKMDMQKVLCFNTNSFTYSSLQEYMAQVLQSRKDLNKKLLPIVLIGDARLPPLPFQIKRYYLIYNPKNFIGEYEMRLYNENTFLCFFLNYPEDFDKYKNIMHRIIYLGSLCRILLICSSDAVLPQKTIKKESIIDYDIIIIKDHSQYLPYHKHLKSFECLVPKKL